MPNVEGLEIVDAGSPGGARTSGVPEANGPSIGAETTVDVVTASNPARAVTGGIPPSDQPTNITQRAP